MYEKKGFKQVLERPDGVLGFSKTNFYFEQRKVDKKWQTGMRNSFLEKVPHNSRLIRSCVE
ncbi:hypothetical protein ACFL0H_11680 [Thermodesulfobacteriota bacterium]